jgi:CheY-like chemotaxis protein
MSATLDRTDPLTIKCRACGARYEPFVAAWCGCIGSSQTLECPQCGRCYCRAPAEWDRLWTNIPPDRRPRRRRIAGFEEIRPNPPGPKGGRHRILVVDDDDDVRRFACCLIESLGYDAVPASNGVEGLAIAQEGRCSLAIADALMPKMDGREMCRRIKTDPATFWMRVIIMTAVYVNPKYGIEARSAFLADDFLCKPISIDALQTAIVRQLGRASATV